MDSMTMSEISHRVALSEATVAPPVTDSTSAHLDAVPETPAQQSPIFVDGFKHGFKNVWKSSGDFFKATGDLIEDSFKDASRSSGNIIRSTGDGLEDGFKDMWNSIKRTSVAVDHLVEELSGSAKRRESARQAAELALRRESWEAEMAEHAHIQETWENAERAEVAYIRDTWDAAQIMAELAHIQETWEAAERAELAYIHETCRMNAERTHRQVEAAAIRRKRRLGWLAIGVGVIAASLLGANPCAYMNTSVRPVQPSCDADLACIFVSSCRPAPLVSPQPPKKLLSRVFPKSLV